MNKERLYYLDWLRVSAFGLLILFHCLRFFDFFPWHIKNEEQSEWLTQFVLYTTSWRMPLIFFVSGAGTYFALRSRGSRFLRDRVDRLIIPYVFGILVLIPPQKYLEFLHWGGENMSYLSFLKVYPAQLVSADIGVNLVWLGHAGYHVWYLAYLFVATMLLLPLLRRIMSGTPGNSLFDRVPPNLLWLFLPLIAINVALRPAFPNYLDWADFLHFMYFFLLGFIFTHNRALLADWISERLGKLLLIAVVTSLATHYFALFTEYMMKWIGAPDYSVDYLAFVAVRTMNALSWVLVLLGFAIRFLNRGHRLLQRLNEAILPVYILHQTIIVIIGYYVVQWSLGIPAKAALITVVSLVLMGVCYWIIRNTPLLRYLFGMKS